MKTTLEIKDELLIRAKNYAKRIGKPLRTVVEDSLRETLSEAQTSQTYNLPDLSVGDPARDDPLELVSWQDLRDEIYGMAHKR